MVSSIALRNLAPCVLLLLLTLASQVLAHKDWVDKLPKCWNECLDETSDGCNSEDCICDASQKTSYLPPAVSCVANSCDASFWKIQTKLLIPLGTQCLFEGNPIPWDVATEANEAAYGSEKPPSGTLFPTTTRNVERPKPTHKHEYDDDDRAFTTTVTETTTNEAGTTIRIIVPVVAKPKTTSYGTTVTETVEIAPTGSAAPSRSTFAETVPGEAESTTAASQTAQETGTSNDGVSGNGSPFDAQGGARRRDPPVIFGALIVAMGALVSL